MADRVKILVPTALRQFAGGREEVEAGGATVGDVLGQLTTAHADLKKHLYKDNGQLRNFVNIYLNDEDIRYLEKAATPVADGDVITIVPAIAGGAQAVEELTLSSEEVARYSRH
ncbi:MAG: ubiquitin-like small modifier protein 1, partial [Thermomicrobiales bacterium]